jgi:hypothetical protein
MSLTPLLYLRLDIYLPPNLYDLTFASGFEMISDCTLRTVETYNLWAMLRYSVAVPSGSPHHIFCGVYNILSDKNGS